MIRNHLAKLSLLVLFIGASFLADAQCPDIYYPTPSNRYSLVRRGWDTLVTCENPAIDLLAEVFVTAQTFDGYVVSAIDYNPPDTTFCSHAGGGYALPVNQDDYYDANTTAFPFSFSFFGRRYNSAVVGPNGNVSFNTSMTSQFMPYSVQNYAPLPSSNSASNSAVKNCIFGLWEDIDPGYISNSGVPNAGIHKAIYTIPPKHYGPSCRMLCVSYNGVPKFGHSSAQEAPTHYSTSQIVCYEGTSIIEVHIKRHSAQCGTDGNKCVVGLLNPTGDTAYCAPGRNPLDNQDITTPEAWRFTPVGTTVRNIRWYLGDTNQCDDQHEILSINPGDSVYKNHYDGEQYLGLHVAPTVPTTYTMRLIYQGSSGDWYDIKYPVHVGTDFSHEIRYTVDTIVCKGEIDTIALDLQSNDLSRPLHNIWQVSNPNVRVNYNYDSTMLVMPGSQPHIFWGTTRNNLYDTTYFSLTSVFSNGCRDSANIRIIFCNRIDDTTYGSICDGQAYTFCGQQYHSVGTYSHDTVTPEQCPYTKFLRLETHNNDYSVDYQKDCHPYTWQDGNTYDETTSMPTVTLQNRWGCDSVVRLSFTMDNSLEAHILANPEHATLDDLHLMLKDVSLGSNSRRWYFPDGRTDTNITVYYEYPTNEDSISFMLVAKSPYGCEDTAYTTIPLLKETIWFPNAFTPARQENNIFKPDGVGIISMEMDIYNRHGLLIKHIVGTDTGWDGTDENGNLVPEGGYVYVVRYVQVIDPDNPKSHKGNVLVIR